jgi:uncharacterized protein YodC (DUF2158 family)
MSEELTDEQKKQVAEENAKLQSPPKPPFQTGDLVRLKSGGPVMTLGLVQPDSTLNNQVECSWFLEGQRQKLSNYFFLGMLRKAELSEIELAKINEN